MRLSRRVSEIEPFHVMELLARARELEAAGRDIVHMEIGEPDFPTPPAVIAAGRRALEQGATSYTPAAGLPALREAIAEFYSQRYGVQVAPARIFVTPGASGALLLALAAAFDRDDELLLADPGYPCNRHFARVLETAATAVPVGPESGYQLTAERIAAEWGPQTRGVLLATPSNPTGTVIEREEMARIAGVVEAREGALLVDEIYHGLIYGEADVTTALAVAPDAIVLNSFSKYFCMTGWRLGWLVVPDSHARAVDKLIQNLFIAASTPAQYAALAAFEPDTIGLLEKQREAFRQRRDFLLPALRELGFTIAVEPRGAFYIYADCRSLGVDSDTLSRDLLERAGVAVTPGRDFGHHLPEYHLRFAYTTGVDRLETGVQRIRSFLRAGG